VHAHFYGLGFTDADAPYIRDFEQWASDARLSRAHRDTILKTVATGLKSGAIGGDDIDKSWQWFFDQARAGGVPAATLTNTARYHDHTINYGLTQQPPSAQQDDATLAQVKELMAAGQDIPRELDIEWHDALDRQIAGNDSTSAQDVVATLNAELGTYAPPAAGEAEKWAELVGNPDSEYYKGARSAQLQAAHTAYIDRTQLGGGDDVGGFDSGNDFGGPSGDFNTNTGGTDAAATPAQGTEQ
jgi:hypothetical protein